MNPRLLAQLGIRHGEGARTGRLFVLILLLTLTVAVAKAAQQGIFLATAARERIADAFVLSALVLALCSLAVSAVAGRVGPVRLFVGLATAVAVLFIGAWTVFLVHADPMALYVLVEASIGLVVVQGWSVATEALDVRSAKRLLPVIGNAAGLGWTLGGFAVAPLSHLIGAVALVPVAAGLLLATAALALVVAQYDIAPIRQTAVKPTLLTSLAAGLHQMATVPLLRTLAILAVVSLLTEQLLDFVLFATAQQELRTPERIAAFMGVFFGVTGALTLLAPLVAGKVLAKLGSATTAQIPLGTALVLALALAVHPSFAAAVLSRGAFRVTESALGSAARGQMQTALPGTARSQGNALLKGVIAPAFYAVGGLGLKFAPAIDLRWLAVAVALLTAIGFVVAGALLRRAYASLLRNSIDDRRLDLNEVYRLDDETLRALADELYCGDRNRELLAAEILAQCRDNPKARLVLRNACALPDRQLQRFAVAALTTGCQREDAQAFAGVLATSTDADVRKSALRGLLHSSGSWQATVATAADQPRSDVTALACAAQIADHCDNAGACQGQSCDRPCGAAVADLQQMATSPNALVRENALWAIGEIGVHRGGTLHWVLGGRSDPERPVFTASYAALGRIAHSDAQQALLAGLADPRTATAAMEGLAAMPDALCAHLPPLLDQLAAGGQIAAAVALGSGTGPHSAAALTHLLRGPQRAVRYRAAKAIAARQHRDTIPEIPNSAVTLAVHDEICSALQATLVLAGVAHRNGNRIPHTGAVAFFCGEVQARIALCHRRMFALLALLVDSKLVDLTQYHVRRNDSKSVAASLELLEHALPAPLRGDVLLVLDGQSLRERYRTLRERPDLDQTATTDPLACVMGPTGDDWLRTCAAYAFKDDMARRYPLQFAQTSTKIPLLQRVHFLRAVSMFDAVSGEDLMQIASAATELALGADQTVFAKGDPSQEIYLLVAGCVIVLDGGAPIATLRPPEVFGELAALDGEPRSATAVCGEPTTLLRIARTDLDEIMERKPQVAREIIRVLARRLRESTARLTKL